MTNALPKIAVIGGTGALGSGLAFKWAGNGYPVIIGSRSSEKGEAAAAALRERVPSASVTGTGNQEAASEADIVVLTVPYAHHGATIAQIKDVVSGKIVVDTTVPLVPPKVARVQLSADWPIAGTTQAKLGESVSVVSAFHNVAATHLQDGGEHDDSDVLVYGNSNDARETVISLVEAAGLRGWHAGSIDNSVVSEALTSVLIFINKKYKINGAGIKIIGDPA